MTVKITPSSNPVSAVDRAEKVAKPGFGKYYTDHMVVAEWSEADGWSQTELKPYGPISLDPAAMVFHYGQEIFEGLKASLYFDQRLMRCAFSEVLPAWLFLNCQQQHSLKVWTPLSSKMQGGYLVILGSLCIYVHSCSPLR
jgi:hypothetical protein